MIDVLIVVTAIILTVIAGITVVNVVTFPRLRRAPASAALIDRSVTGSLEPTLVSVCIPARNEAEVIGGTIQSLLAQDHPMFEVLLLDDGSTDGTSEIARQAAARHAGGGDSRLRILRGMPLPAGWLGKNWACHQLSTEARGKILIFTDADVQWDAEALTGLVAMLIRKDADLLTVWATQITRTWAERLVVPLIAFVIFGYLPVPLVHYTRNSAFAAANGQCLAFRRRAYDRIGGHMAVRASIVEDIAFARLIKRKGFRLRMADGAGLIACRMYHNWNEVRDGFAKNIIGGYGGVIPFLLGVAFHWLILLFPWVALFSGNLTAGAALIGLGIFIRALTATATRQRVFDSLLLPVSALLMTLIALRALDWRVRGGPRWKGRIAAVSGAPTR